jgi:membrane protein DedA with SNARE-associated domain
MHPERVVVARVSAVVAAVVTVTVVIAVVIIAAVVGAFGSLLLGHLVRNHLFQRPPTSSGYDHRNSRYPHSP